MILITRRGFLASTTHDELCVDLSVRAPWFGPHAGYVFKIRLHFPPTLPFHPPKVLFRTFIFHGNVDDHNQLKCSLLADDWTPFISLSNLLVTIQSILGLSTLEPVCNADFGQYREHNGDVAANDYARMVTRLNAQPASPKEFAKYIQISAVYQISIDIALVLITYHSFLDIY
jgi:ubiquitin-protein ligase